MTSFVLDASVTLNWCLGEEPHPAAEAATGRLRDASAAVPALWWFEVGNGLIMAERRKRLSEEQSVRFLGLLAVLPIEVDRSPSQIAVLTLARRHKLTVYDAAYLELSQRLAVPLATLDADLRSAARAEMVGLLGSE